MTGNEKQTSNNVSRGFNFLIIFALGLLTAILWNQIFVEQRQADISILNKHSLELFEKYDLDKNGVLSPNEFASLATELLDSVKITEEEEAKKWVLEEDNYDPLVDEVLRLKSSMTPLVLKSMSQTSKDPAFGSPNFKYPGEFEGLSNWKKVNQPQMEIYARHFKVLLPPEHIQDVLGKPYWVLPKVDSPDLTSFRYQPPEPSSEAEALLYKLLSMFHPKAFITIRFPPQGGVAVVRAENPVYFDIYFRFHCEFQLNSPPRKPFWFTPSQFTGHVTMSRDGSHVRDFHLFVPNSKKLNVDMEWETEDGDGNMEVDIGYLPRLELKQLAPSSPAQLRNQDGSVLDRRKMWETGQDLHLEFDRIAWHHQVDEKEALKSIEKLLYPFKQVEYFNFSAAFERARSERKLVHQVVLWGALDDQSC